MYDTYRVVLQKKGKLLFVSVVFVENWLLSYKSKIIHGRREKVVEQRNGNGVDVLRKFIIFGKF